jgi:hypothetical protein
MQSQSLNPQNLYPSISISQPHSVSQSQYQINPNSNLLGYNSPSQLSHISNTSLLNNNKKINNNNLMNFSITESPGKYKNQNNKEINIIYPNKENFFGSSLKDKNNYNSNLNNNLQADNNDNRGYSSLQNSGIKSLNLEQIPPFKGFLIEENNNNQNNINFTFKNNSENKEFKIPIPVNNYLGSKKDFTNQKNRTIMKNIESINFGDLNFNLNNERNLNNSDKKKESIFMKNITIDNKINLSNEKNKNDILSKSLDYNQK